MTSWNPGDQPSGQPGYGQQPGQQPPPPNFDKGPTPPPAAPPPAYGAPAPQPGYGQSAPQPGYGQSAPQPAYGQQPPAYGGGGYAAPPTNQYGNNPYGGAPVGNLPPGAVQPLNMGNRVVAFIIDYVILNVFSIIAIIILFTGVLASTSTLDCSSYQIDPNTGAVTGGCVNSGGAGAGVVITFVVFLILWIAVLVAWVWMLGTKGQTPGKRWMGVKVVDNDSGAPIGFGRALLRYIVQYLSNIVCYAGLWSAWLDGPPEGRYRGWHDKAVNSVVISVK